MRNDKCDRAKLFLPFDALKGFREALREKEKTVVERVELSEEENDKLGVKIRQIKKESRVKVIYYRKGKYLEIEGLVSRIDFECHYVTIAQTKIIFEDILDVKGDGIYIDEFSNVD